MTKTADLILEMLNAPKTLSSTELNWVRKIDSSTSSQTTVTFNARQREVIQNIYGEFKKRRYLEKLSMNGQIDRQALFQQGGEPTLH